MNVVSILSYVTCPIIWYMYVRDLYNCNSDVTCGWQHIIVLVLVAVAVEKVVM